MKEKIVLAAGCFWCTEAVFQRIQGVEKVVPGYTGGAIKNPAYREVCSGRTGHAEGVEVTYDASVVTIDELLEIYFATHDPTTLNQQGNDRGTQYRSAIFYTTDQQKRAAKKLISLLEENKVFDNPIVTELTPLDVFYTAEVDHHEYYNNNKQQPYCQFIIDPKIKKIKTYYSDKLK
ncbi:MAG TPA: peptide-methionine (S)-S-oxide reductase [Flavobacteriaceae bacterium]|jgi:peptide-methionine (S)-S-oxide reductase|nr:peptide-methionine (S)-S-oxide reductase [Flavobacteriaceae bacterium]MAM27505.1 peptide-methionine (S)-S-oxide reductase [Flavobacteriaceae bacterium]HBR54104.1 peptide-methionine (S)-S-oxide reductase [Flavobacteriaceae bacterium]HIB48050.1 peptide-methionine (S)-S-oxide reductase MsrA [Flavobacteriaceae bacterium]HIN98697.1 peptide-methionine (S)-S-oxide reductase [Flavobacteriaceae bacterium]|tara:strand:+ start:621 stop:1151 length:531 start_codon:yes stop_codon:yes gene_type:complete